jgi:hypothetical protein
VFVPSLSWQNDHFVLESINWRKKDVSLPVLFGQTKSGFAASTSPLLQAASPWCPAAPE